MTTRGSCQAFHVQIRIVGQGIGLQVAPDEFHWIEFRGIRGKKLNSNCREGRKKSCYRLRPVAIQSVPNHQEWFPFKLFGKLLEERENQRGVDIGVRVQSETATNPVALRGNIQGSDRRDLLVGAAPLIQDRSCPFRCPSASNQWRHHESRLVHEHQGGFQACGVFFTRGHSSLTQRRISSSSRSTARRWGFWGLHPRACRRRPI